MSESQSLPTRRSAIKAAAGASVLAGVAVPHVHAQVNEEVKLALIGCGGRGTGAVKNALSVSGTLGPVKLHAMADVFDDNLNRSHEVLMKDKVLSEHINDEFICCDDRRESSRRAGYGLQIPMV